MGLKSRYQNLRQKVKSRTSRQSVAGLSYLPPEILSLIFSHICVHCSRPADLELSDSEEGKLTFKSLSLTCQALRPLAQSFLFHSLWLRFGLRGFRSSKDCQNFDVLRTLIEYPELAASVQRITMGGSEMACRPERLEVVRNAKPKVSFHTGPMPSNLEDEVMFTRLTRDLFVSLAHNLTELSFPLGFRRGDYRAADIADALSIAKHGGSSSCCGSMPSLRTLTLFPERGADFIIDDPRIRTFLCAAPNLNRLVIDQLTNMIGLGSGGVDASSKSASHLPPDTFLDELPRMHNLKSIHLQHCMVVDDAPGINVAALQRLVAIAPNLRRFQFGAGFNTDFHVLSSSRVLAILEPFHATLVDLGLHYNAVLPYLDGGSVNLKGLSQFQSLRVLRLDEAAFCEHRHSGHLATDSETAGFDNPVQRDCLTRILPLSVHILHLVLMHGCAKQYDALQLALKVASGRFSSLLHVQIESTMNTPHHGATQVQNQQELHNGGRLSLPKDESDVVVAFLRANIKVWVRDAGWFDDWDVGSLLNLV